MPMSPRLLRPRASGATHPEALDWASRVTTNGGTVSSTTLAAVSTFCAAINAAGIRSKFMRLNLMCGSGISACIVPLYRGTSFGGTVLGNAVDTNVGPFVAGDYAETGSPGGLKGAGTSASKYLRTGLLLNSFASLTNRHLAVYETERGNANQCSIGGGATGTGNAFFLRPATSTDFRADFNAISVGVSSYTGGATFFIGQNDGLRSAALYRNGVATTGTLSADVTANSNEIQILAAQFDGTTGLVRSVARCAGYSIGEAFTSGEASAYDAAMQAFQATLGRNV